MPSGVTESITNVSGYYFKVTLTIPEHSKPASRTLTIRANQPNGLDRELVQTVQQSASTYEFGIIVNSVEGKITINSIQSTTKDRSIGDKVYVWAYNSVRGLWLSIGNFRIEEGTNMHHWDTSWPS